MAGPRIRMSVEEAHQYLRGSGFESPIVILWGLDTIDLSQRQELLYVGMSRAKSLLVIVGRAATCAVFKEAASQ